MQLQPFYSDRSCGHWVCVVYSTEEEASHASSRNHSVSYVYGSQIRDDMTSRRGWHPYMYGYADSGASPNKLCGVARREQEPDSCFE